VAKNFYFENFSNSMEQELIEDLVIESIRIYGQDVWYLPRTIANKDELYNEDTLSIFDDAYLVEMYVKNVDGFEGEGDFLSKFGLQIRDSMTMTVAIRSFNQEVAVHGDDVRPNEGDLLYFPLNNKFFEVMHVEHEAIFYQMGQLQTYDLRCELFEYSGERFETGQDFIDDYWADKGYDIFVPQGNTYFDVAVSNGVFTVLEQGSQDTAQEQPFLNDFYVDSTYVFDQSDASNAGLRLTINDGPTRALGAEQVVSKTGTPGANGAFTTWTPTTAGTYYYINLDNDYLGGEIRVYESKIENVELYDNFADNETIESEADNILDFSESNPFGEI
jgi:hypothetical protein